MSKKITSRESKRASKAIGVLKNPPPPSPYVIGLIIVEQDLWNGVLHLVQMRGVKSFLIVFLHFPQCRFAGGAVGVGGRGVGVSALVFACPSVCWAHRHAVFDAYFPIPLHLGTRWQTLSHDGAVQARGFVPLRMAFLHAVQISDAVATGSCCWMAC